MQAGPAQDGTRNHGLSSCCMAQGSSSTRTSQTTVFNWMQEPWVELIWCKSDLPSVWAHCS
eukprot:11113838-Prorocentrum_lima.AAC.1